MKHSRIAVGLAMIAIFSASFGILWNQRKKAELPARSPEVPTIAGPGPTAASGAANRARNDRSAPAHDAAPLTSAAATGAAPGTTIVSGPVEMPVELHFRQRLDQGKVQGSVLNNSGTDLVIEAVVVSASTKETAKFQLVVPPYGAIPFGLDDGLDMHSGDQITLRSPPYRDKTAAIP
ncbi:MAG: hypothetical protein ABSH33_08850 [Steroidobacteraceae bacterium]